MATIKVRFTAAGKNCLDMVYDVRPLIYPIDPKGTMMTFKLKSQNGDTLSIKKSTLELTLVSVA